MSKPRTTFYLLWRAGPSRMVFYGSGLVCLPSWLGKLNAGWLGSICSEIFLQMKFIILRQSHETAFLCLIINIWWRAKYTQQHHWHGFNDIFSTTGFYFKSKVIEGSHKGKICFFTFWALLFKMQIFEVVTFCSSSTGDPVNSIFQWQYAFIRFIFFYKAFFLLTVRMPMVTKLVRVVTCWEKLSTINLHETSTD